MKVLVVGAQIGSLGEAIASAITDADEVVTTAGLSGHETYTLDALDTRGVLNVLEEVRPTHIVSTVGVNIPATLGDLDFFSSLQKSLSVNLLAPLHLLRRATEFIGREHLEQFVAISSNSAQIARRGSTPYCSSKAALSMALRCAARELGGRPLVYGYEFGLLQGTPMTQEVAERFSGPLTRMVGAPDGLNVTEAATAVARNLLSGWHGLNGSLLRLDAGEQ